MSEYNLQRNGYAKAFQAAVVQWAAAGSQVQSIGWTLISDATSANAFGASIAGMSRAFSGGTATGPEITFSAGLFDTLHQRAQGITINGLPIGNQNLADFYSANVIGGTGALVERAATVDGFAEAIGRKLEREIVSTVIPVPCAPALKRPHAGLQRFLDVRRETSRGSQ